MRRAEGRQPTHAGAVHYKLMGTALFFLFMKGLLCEGRMTKALKEENEKQGI